jgi:hypothetical protein
MQLRSSPDWGLWKQMGMAELRVTERERMHNVI